MSWTAEQWREHRAAQGKINHATVLPASTLETGRELRDMMEMPLRDFCAKYLEPWKEDRQ